MDLQMDYTSGMRENSQNDYKFLMWTIREIKFAFSAIDNSALGKGQSSGGRRKIRS